MNALILSAVFGVVMMFSGIMLKQKSCCPQYCHCGMILLLLVNILEMGGTVFFKIRYQGHDCISTGLPCCSIPLLLFQHLFILLLSARDMEKVGINYAEYFALIFFILCGVTLTSSFKSLLMLFLGIEIISIPLYILTGSDKRNLKSNEASLKYFLLGAFSTGLMLMGIALDLWGTGNF